MEQLRILIEVWPALLTLIALVVWLVRLEGKINYNERDLASLRAEHNALNSKTLGELSQIRESLARIEGRLSAKNEL